MLRSSPIERALASASERQARKEIGMQVHKDTLATRLAAVVDAVTPGHAGDSPAIETVGLTKSYGTLTAVDHLNLTIERGEIFGFLGPNGAGKTTTMRMLLGLIRPTAGSARVLGMDIATDLPAILSRTGSIIENPTFYPYLSGWDTMRMLARVTAVTDDPIPPILVLVDLPGAARRKSKTYPPGIHRRLAGGPALRAAPH